MVPAVDPPAVPAVDPPAVEPVDPPAAEPVLELPPLADEPEPIVAFVNMNRSLPPPAVDAVEPLAVEPEVPVVEPAPDPPADVRHPVTVMVF